MTAQPVTVRFWASARAAAGVDSVEVAVMGPVTLDDVVRRVLADADPRLERVLAVCSVLVGDRPAGTQKPDEVLVNPGETVEFLPPFAGG
jgi:molybdopterin converting factor small subunit